MNHRELFDAMVERYVSDLLDPNRPRKLARDRQSFTQWLNMTKDGRNVRAKIDLLDQVANGWPDDSQSLAPVESMVNRLGTLEAEMALYIAHVENLIQRVYDLEPNG